MTLRSVSSPLVGANVTLPPLLPDVVSCVVVVEDASTADVAPVMPICVIVLGVTVSVNVQVPVSFKVSESVPETV